MAWTYGDPAEERKDEVRFLVGDTDTTVKMVQDEEIEMILGQYPPATGRPAWLAAAATCDAIAGKFGRKMQQGLGPLSASNQQQFEHYVQLAQQMRVLYATNGLGSGQGMGMSGVRAASPVLGGGGRTYLGPQSYTQGEG